MWYEAVLEADDNGAFLVTVPAFPEIATFGESELDALHGRGTQSKKPLPPESRKAAMFRNSQLRRRALKVKLPWLTFLKTALYIACRDKGITRAELARRLEWNREQVERLFKLDHNSRLDQLEAAYRAAGLNVTLSVPEVVEVEVA